MKIQTFTISSLTFNGANCTLIIFEDENLPGKKLQIMIDCGINQKMEFSKLKHFFKKMHKTHLVLLSGPGLEYCGGLPIVLNSNIFQPSTQIIAPSPVVDFGLRNFVDQYINLQQSFMQRIDPEYPDDKQKQEEEFNRLVDSVESSFSRVVRLNFQQKQEFKLLDDSFNIIVTPIRAGSCIGQCAWKISVNMTNIIYISEYSMIKELHIDPLAVDKLIIQNEYQKQSILHKQQIDLLIMESILASQVEQEKLSVKRIIQDKLAQILKNSNACLVAAFYPNERILEGIMAIESIINQSHDRLDIRCELYSNYTDIIEKARGSTDFLGLSFLNWKYQDQSHQSPLDPDYLKNKFLDIKHSLDEKDSISGNQCRIILATYNSLFMGPMNIKFKNILENRDCHLILFGQPKSLICDNMKFLKKDYKGIIDFQMKDNDSITLNNIRKLLMKRYSEQNNSNPAQSSLLSTQLPGTNDQTDSQSIDQTKSYDKYTEESSLQLQQQQMELEVEFVQEEEQIFDLKDHQQFPVLFKNDPELQYQLIFQTDSRPNNLLRQLPSLVKQDDDYGLDPPDNIFIIKHQHLQSVQKSSDSELNSIQNEKKETNWVNFVQPRQVIKQPINFVAQMQIHQLEPGFQDTKQLLEYINPKNIHFLYPQQKKQHLTGDWNITIGVYAQMCDVFTSAKVFDIPFLNANPKELESTIVRVQIKQKIEQSKKLVQLSKQNVNQKFHIVSGKQILMTKLFQFFKSQNIDCTIGFGQICIGNEQIIISRVDNGFSIEGAYSQQYQKVRQLIQAFYIQFQ